MVTPLILSKSSIETFTRCQYAWYLANVIRLPSPPNLDMAVGRAVHKGVEAHWLGTSTPPNGPHGELEASWVGEIKKMPPAVWIEEDLEANRLAAHRMLDVYLANIAPTFNPTLIEAPFLIRVDGVLFSGIIDAADGDVHDTKTTSTPSKVDPASHRLGMTAYWFGYRALTGREPGRLLLDVVARNGRWAIKEVEPDFAELAEVVGYVAGKVNAGDFEPTGVATGQCPNCPFLDRCRFGAPFRLDSDGKMQSAFVTGEETPLD